MQFKALLRILAVVFLAWTMLALLLGFQMYTNGLNSDSRIALSRAIFVSVCNYWLYAVLTPPIIWLAIRFRITRERWVSRLAIHFAGFLLFSAGYSLLRGFVFPLLNQFTGYMGSRSLSLAIGVFKGSLFWDLWMYFAIVALTYAAFYYAESRKRQLQEVRLQAQLSQAQLQLLKAQLQPHFIFNTLHAISTLMSRDVPGARRMIVRLSELLRMAMQRIEAHELTLKEELEFVRNYLEIEQIRFQDRLTIQFEISPEVLDAMVPALLLQPLVENAVRHGIAVQSRQGWIGVKAKPSDGCLEISIEDNGPGLADAFRLREGVGIPNTRARLEQLYASEYTFELKSRPEAGLNVAITIPLRVSSRTPQTVVSVDG
jgi:signal transduction histidine kinase